VKMARIVSRLVFRRSHRLSGIPSPSGVKASHAYRSCDLFQNWEKTVYQNKSEGRFIPPQHLK